MEACTKKEGSTDCGVHAIAVGAAIACGKSLEGDAKPCTSFAVLKICHSQINHNKIYYIIATFNCIDSDFRTSCNYPVCTSSLIFDILTSTLTCSIETSFICFSTSLAYQA